mmetsp:Transcript_47377/g.85340  ORF Transcript_47377/g.85340 Transcript_47377/m.85340 type:complete len:257 (-) Transcript_47377:228-998(-)
MSKRGPWGDTLQLTSAKRRPSQSSQLGPWGDRLPSKADRPSKADKGPWGEVGEAVLDAVAGPWGDALQPCRAKQHPQVSLDFDAGSVESLVRDVLRTQSAQANKVTRYVQNGADAKQVEKRWLTGGKSCRCGKASGTCSKQVDLERLQAVCKEFWGIPAAERAELFRILYVQQHGSEGSLLGSIGEPIEPLGLVAVQWNLAGKRVCFSNFVHLLGTSQNSIRNSINGVPICRKSAENLACPASLPSQSKPGMSIKK